MAEEDPFKAKITAWLNEQGYPLEMRVASALQQRGYRVVQSEYFFDPESGDSREIDVVAFKQKKTNGVLFRISLLIECKRSTDKPWILFTSGATHLADPARVTQRAANSLGRHFLHEACQTPNVQDFAPILGHGTTGIRRNSGLNDRKGRLLFVGHVCFQGCIGDDS
jgi:Holliday junction resolvase